MHYCPLPCVLSGYCFQFYIAFNWLSFPVWLDPAKENLSWGSVLTRCYFCHRSTAGNRIIIVAVVSSG